MTDSLGGEESRRDSKRALIREPGTTRGGAVKRPGERHMVGRLRDLDVRSAENVEGAFRRNPEISRHRPDMLRQSGTVPSVESGSAQPGAASRKPDMGGIRKRVKQDHYVPRGSALTDPDFHRRRQNSPGRPASEGRARAGDQGEKRPPSRRGGPGSLGCTVSAMWPLLIGIAVVAAAMIFAFAFTSCGGS